MYLATLQPSAAASWSHYPHIITKHDGMGNNWHHSTRPASAWLLSVEMWTSVSSMWRQAVNKHKLHPLSLSYKSIISS